MFILHLYRQKRATVAALQPLQLQAFVKRDLTLTLMDQSAFVTNWYCSADLNGEQVTMSYQFLIMLLKEFKQKWKGGRERRK